MLFNSFEFLVFFPIVVGIFFVIPRKTRYVWLLVTSYYFYMSWNAKYALLLAFSTFVTWLSGIMLDRINQTGSIFEAPSKDGAQIKNTLKQKPGESTVRKRKLVVALSLIINLGILALFKYFDFIFFNINVTLSVFSIEPFEKPFDLLLPVGISFYTFQALSYTMDVYRGEVQAERNPLKYALFVSFFPQLVAGPIERSKNLLTQIQHVHEFKLWNLDRVTRGFILMIWGYFLKMVIADRTAVFVNNVYDNCAAMGQTELIIATVLFGLQIMCDFAGYSTIAIGAAKIMGFELMENFNTPYFAQSIQEFWRRWHISLSTWFRDYLYFPLGGSRCSKAKHYRNIMIVFVVSGVWHGAAWGFIIWGVLHGLYQVIGIATRPAKERFWKRLGINTSALLWRLGKVAVTFVLVMFAWLFFRAQTIGTSVQVLERMLTQVNPWVLFDGSLFGYGLVPAEFIVLGFAIVILLAVDGIRYVKGKNLADYLMTKSLGFRWFVMLGLICLVLVFGIYGGEYDAAEFIYFQF